MNTKSINKQTNKKLRERKKTIPEQIHKKHYTRTSEQAKPRVHEWVAMTTLENPPSGVLQLTPRVDSPTRPTNTAAITCIAHPPQTN